MNSKFTDLVASLSNKVVQICVADLGGFIRSSTAHDRREKTAKMMKKVVVIKDVFSLLV